MTRIKHPFVSFSLVAAQFALITALLLVLPLSLNPFILAVQIIAIAIGIWAVATMHLGEFNIVPDPRDETEIITHGPYRFIRHPMYFSILLFFIPLLIRYPDWIAIGLYTALFLALFIKLSYEEHLLSENLPEYIGYQQRSKRLIPFLF